MGQNDFMDIKLLLCRLNAASSCWLRYCGHGLRSDGSVREEDEEEEEEEEAVQVRQSLCWGGQADEGKHAAQPFPRESKGSL